MSISRGTFLRLSGGALAGASFLGLASCGRGTNESNGPTNLSVMDTDDQRKDYYRTF